jgi:hypothetical protein
VLVSWKSGSTLYWQFFDKTDKPVGEVQSKLVSNSSRHAGVVGAEGFVLVD